MVGFEGSELVDESDDWLGGLGIEGCEGLGIDGLEGLGIDGCDRLCGLGIEGLGVDGDGIDGEGRDGDGMDGDGVDGDGVDGEGRDGDGIDGDGIDGEDGLGGRGGGGMLTGEEHAATQSNADQPTHFHPTTRARTAGRLAWTPEVCFMVRVCFLPRRPSYGRPRFVANAGLNGS